MTADGPAIEDLEEALEAATALTDADKSTALVDLAAASRTDRDGWRRDRVDVAGQMAALATAVAALDAIDLDDLMTQDDIDAAERGHRRA